MKWNGKKLSKEGLTIVDDVEERMSDLEDNEENLGHSKKRPKQSPRMEHTGTLFLLLPWNYLTPQPKEKELNSQLKVQSP